MDEVKPALAPTQADVRSAEPQTKKIIFDTYQATIEEMDTHMPNLWEIRFSLDKPMKFVAGQYVSIYLPNIHPAPFSIASSPIEENTLALGIEVVGPATTALTTMKPGDKITMKGPFGNFTMGPEKKVCFLAGGVGITPFMCMLRWIRDTHADKQAVLLYSCKERHQFLWFEELEAMVREHPNIRVVFTCTREAPPNWTYKTGRITADVVREVIPDFAEYTFFCCGPPPLISAMHDTIVGMGVPEPNFRREAWHG